MSRRTQLGVFSVSAGAAHLVAPRVFTRLTKLAFPEAPEVWVRRNGITEMAIGAAFLMPRTVRAGPIGLLAYAAWIGYNVIRVQRRGRIVAT